MGFRLRKVFTLPLGFRINASKSGLGVSWGVPGFRVGTGPSGERLTACIPGTGLGWQTEIGGGSHTERTARGRQRSLRAKDRDMDRARELERNAHQVAVFENKLELLVSLHKDGWSTWDWSAVAHAPPPELPKETGAQALAAHDVAQKRWEWFRGVANGVMAGDIECCKAVLQYLGPFNELSDLGSSLQVTVAKPWCVEAWLVASTHDVVPEEVLSLTPTGRLSKKKMPKGRYWGLYQDHVCSAAFRIAREVFALLPIPVVFVHIKVPMRNSAKGHFDDNPVLSVAFERETFVTLDLDHIDPSDALGSFEHAMKFRKIAGFRGIEPLSPDEFEAVEGDAEQQGTSS